jgi:hypothetical protein
LKPNLASSQLELSFERKALARIEAAVSIPAPEQPVRQLRPYKIREGDRRFRRRVKQQRGCHCERCGFKAPLEKLSVHHILETRAYPEFAREALNVIVLCEPCHSTVTDAERFGISRLMLFYSKLNQVTRTRHLPFLERTLPPSSAAVTAFREGNSRYWNDRTVRDVCR